MLIHNKQERTNNIWRFVGVAAIPLALFFLAGLSLGNTAGLEKENYKTMYLESLVKADSLAIKVEMFEAFSIRAEALLKHVDVQTDALGEKLSKAASESDKESIILLGRDEGDLFRDVEDSIHVLGRDFRQVGTDAVVKSGFTMLNAYIGFKKIRQMKYREDLMSKINEGSVIQLQDELDKIEAEKKEIAKLIEGQKAGSEMSDLKAQLRDCQKELKALEKSQSGGGNKNKEAVASIKKTLNTVQTDMLPKMNDNMFRNNSKKLNELKTQIANSLTIATTELNSIQ